MWIVVKKVSVKIISEKRRDRKMGRRERGLK
jgi:hypothetical protein